MRLQIALLFMLAAWGVPASAQETAAPVEDAAVAEPPATVAEPEVLVPDQPAPIDAQKPDAAEADTVVEVPAEVADNEAVEDEVAAEQEPIAGAEGTDWAGLIERAPAFLALTHHAAVHMPIALWLFGAFFVVVGVVVPSLRNQIPVACLIGGAITSVAAVASGWWYAEYSWGEPWTWDDGFGDWSEHLVKHRWTGVALAFASLGLSIVAIISQVKKSRRLGVIWRLGLIGLAAAVAWEGHLGGELIQGEGFMEDAFEEWVNPPVDE